MLAVGLHGAAARDLTVKRCYDALAPDGTAQKNAVNTSAPPPPS